MGAILKRKKPKSILTAIVYRLSKLFTNNPLKFSFLLDVEWIFERLSYEQASVYYGVENTPWRQSSVKFLSNVIKPDDVVLDLGCGYGAVTHAISLMARKVVGVDYNIDSILSARKYYQRDNLQFIHEDALHYLKQSGEKFSVLILTHVLEHLDNPKHFLATYANYFCYIFIEVPDFDRTFLNHFRQDISNDQVYTDADHVSEFDRDELNAILAEVNLVVVSAEYRYGVQKIWVKCS
jgi:SAM-dependent methyltransferase